MKTLNKQILFPKILFSLIIVAFTSSLVADKPTISPKMKLYLASEFGQVWDDIVELLPLTPKESLACHVTTAGFNADWTKANSKQIESSGFTVRRIDIANYDDDTIAEPFEGCDLIYVGGGDEFYLLQEFRRSGFDELVLKQVAEGMPYIGSSAGSMVLGSSIEFSKSIRNTEASPLLTSYEGLNLIPLSLFVHFDNPDLKEIYRTILDFAWEDSTMFLTMNDKQFVFVEGNRWRVIESK